MTNRLSHGNVIASSDIEDPTTVVVPKGGELTVMIS
jgi:hypothetical protein